MRTKLRSGPVLPTLPLSSWARSPRMGKLQHTQDIYRVGVGGCGGANREIFTRHE